MMNIYAVIATNNGDNYTPVVFAKSWEQAAGLMPDTVILERVYQITGLETNREYPCIKHDDATRDIAILGMAMGCRKLVYDIAEESGVE
jgi:hypothetical protein